MKAPAFLGGALATARKAVSGVGAASSRLSSLVGGGLSALKGAMGQLAARVGGKARKAIALAAVASLVAALAMLLGAAIAASGSRKVEAATERLEEDASPSVFPAIPRAGPELAALLLVPGEGEPPYPLALEPKARYTEADAASILPDLGAVDVSELIRRREAELEAIYGAVD